MCKTGVGSHPFSSVSLSKRHDPYEQAKPLFLRALSICEQHLGSEHPLTVRVLRGLAELSEEQ
jgi:hypothetical protein